MTPRTLMRLVFAAIPVLSARFVCAMDMRFDVATDNNSGDDTDWFGPSQLTNLNFPSVNGHNIEQGSNSNASAITAAGNTLGMYYDTFDSLYSSTETPTAAVSTVQSWIKLQFGSYNTSGWLVLNEVDSSTWNGSSGSAYRTWLVNTMSAFNAAGYKNIILYAENSLAGGTYASTWQAITQYAHIGDECYIDGQVVQSDNFSVSTLQAVYQASYNAWTSGSGISAANLILGEHFSVNEYAPSTYWGADGISGTAWEEAIEARDIAIHNIPFGGFIGYAWDKDAQATGNPTVDLANQEAYEKAYASTLVVQTEVPAWTGNDGTTSWADYLNWTGGLPSTTSAPFPLLASTNPNLPKQTAANFLTAITANTTITLDGNQSITNLSFGSPYSYTIAPGTGGSLTMTGSGASIAVTSGSHSIIAGLVLGSDVAANLTGNLTLSGGLTNNGYTLSETGGGTLTISGIQTNSANSAIAVSAGTLNLDSDTGSSAASTVALSMSSGLANINASQHLSSLSCTGGDVKLASGVTVDLASSLSVASTGYISTHSDGLSIDNPSASALTLTGTPDQILLDFDTAVGSSGPYWALRWQGDHVAALEADLDQFGFTGNGSIEVEANRAYFDSNDLTVGTTTVGALEYTYIGFASTTPEPVAFSLLLPAGLMLLGRRRKAP